MEEDTIVGLPRPGRVVEDDPLLCVLRQGARRMLTHAIEAEVAGFLAAHEDLVDDRGRRRLVRNGHAPSRAIQTGIGPIEVRRPRVHDRGAGDAPRIRFTSAVLPAYLRRARNVEELLPWLYLKGISTGQFEDALTALLGPDAPGLSPTTIRRLVSTWQDDHRRWQGRDLSTKRYVYVWADGVYFTPRLEHDRQCVLVLIGAEASGKKELLAIDDGFRESEQSWHELLVRLRDQNGLVVDPELVTGDGALGFWKAARKVWPMARQQRCWVGLLKNECFCEIDPDLVSGEGEPHEMLGRKERRQPELFIAGALRDVLPDDHVLVRIDRVLDLSWLPGEVADLYDAGAGRPSVDPEVAVRLMLAGFLLGIVHDRRLLREAQVNLAIRWFCGYGLHEALPDHSSLTRIRQRWGAERFRRLFERTVQACLDAKIAKGEVVHIDASLIRADVSWESLALRHVEAVSRENEAPEDEAEKVSRKTGKYKKVSVTDPDATMATTARNRRLEPAYQQHAVVDDVRGVILAARSCGRRDRSSTAASSIPALRTVRVVPWRRPACRRAASTRRSWSAITTRRSWAPDVGGNAGRRRTGVSTSATAGWRSEGFHGEAKTWHGLARAVRRGLQNMRIRAFLTAAAVNLKRLAATLLAFLLALWSRSVARAPRLPAAA